LNANLCQVTWHPPPELNFHESVPRAVVLGVGSSPPPIEDLESELDVTVQPDLLRTDSDSGSERSAEAQDEEGVKIKNGNTGWWSHKTAIGCSFSLNSSQPVVVRMLSSGPAAKSRLVDLGDVLLTVNGKVIFILHEEPRLCRKILCLFCLQAFSSCII